MELAPSEGRSSWWSPRRYPATLLLLAALVATALGTGTALGGLPQRFVHRFGFAPADLWALDLWRLFSSALVTQGGATFLLALVMVAVAVGMVEHRVGSWRAFLTFWGAHVWTLLIMSVALRVALAGGQPGIEDTVATLRDVGPSAGYFGCLGVAMALPKDRRAGWAGTLGISIWLVADMLGQARGTPAQVEVSADIAHLTAFVSGWAPVAWRRRFGPSGPSPAGRR